MAKRVGMEVAIAASEAVALCNIDMAAVYPITPGLTANQHYQIASLLLPSPGKVVGKQS